MHWSVDRMPGLLVDREVALVHGMHVVAAKIRPVCRGCDVELELAENAIDDRGVLLLEGPGIVAERVLAVVIAVLRHLVNEEQR